MEKAPFQQIIELSGLPESDAEHFLTEAFEKRGREIKNGDLEDLRFILADILQDLILATEEH